jgi:hypothetical protein
VPSNLLARLATAESLYADLRTLRDRIDVSEASGRLGHIPSALVREHNSLWKDVTGRLAGIDSQSLDSVDLRALALMRRTLGRDLDSLAERPRVNAITLAEPGCRYDARSIAIGLKGLDSLRGRMYACYGWAQAHLSFEGTRLDASPYSALLLGRVRRHGGGGSFLPSSRYGARLMVTRERRARTGS